MKRGKITFWHHYNKLCFHFKVVRKQQWKMLLISSTIRIILLLANAHVREHNKQFTVLVKSSPVYISNDVADASLALSTNSAIAPNIKLCVVLKYSKFHE